MEVGNGSLKGRVGREKWPVQHLPPRPEKEPVKQPWLLQLKAIGVLLVPLSEKSMGMGGLTCN